MQGYLGLIQVRGRVGRGVGRVGAGRGWSKGLKMAEVWWNVGGAVIIPRVVQLLRSGKGRM